MIQLKSVDLVCLEIDHNIEVLLAEKPCKWSMKYQSIIGYGKAQIIEDFEEKRCNGNNNEPIHQRSISNTTMFKVIIDEMTGKQSGI